VSFPILAAAPLFSPGVGATIAADLEVGGLLAPFIEAGLAAEPTRNTGNSLQLTQAGAGLNVLWFPAARLKVRAGGGAGVYGGTYGETGTTNFYWKAGADVGWRFSPGFTLAAGGHVVQYLYQGGSHYTGVALGITADVNLSLFSNRSTGLGVEGSQGEPVFPVLYTTYETAPVGSVTITNTEQAEIRDVEVFFQAGSYTSARKPCARFGLVARGASVQAPLYASFSEQVLTLSENTKVQGELVVIYRLLGSRREARKEVAVRFANRNAATWQDPRLAAAFVSPNDPAVLEHSKYIAGLVRDRLRGGIDANLQYGMGFFEGLRLSGVAFAPDPTTPYAQYRASADAVDYLQYPYQTLAYRSGDCDDLAILYAASLESVGIRTAFVPLADDFCVAFLLSMDAAEAASAFVDPSLVILRGKAAWVPVQVSRIREGFLAAWQGGAALCAAAGDGAGGGDGQGGPAGMFTLEEAWKAFRPIGVPGVEPRVPKPSEEQVSIAFDNAVARFISREIGPKAEKLLSRMQGGKGSARQHNTLGMLYARYDLLKDARVQFEAAAAEDYVPALCNLGNVAFLERKYEEAVTHFEKAMRLQPDAKAALLGLARASYELDLFAQSDALFSAVRQLDPELADRFAYLSTGVAGSASRASAAAERRSMLWSDEAE
jgi:tetratricopeptide (TPR) repeat protein